MTPEERKKPETEHAEIWLSPICDRCNPDGRTWCQDDMGPCDDCGAPSVRFVRADAAEARVAGAVEAERERWMRVFEYACTIPADNRRGVWVQAFIEDKTWAVTDFHKWSATAIRSTP